MANSYTVLWTNELCRELIRGGFAGQRPTVPFGGPPTTFQTFLDQQSIPRSKSWRTLGT